MGQFSVGQPLRRVEDARLLKGEGEYCDDIHLPGEVHAVFVRSPFAHADITGVDISDAKAAPGVLGVFTIEDLSADGIPDIPCFTPMPGKNGTTTIMPPRPVLGRDRVRHVGEAVVVVVAETLAQAKDAADLVMVDYDDLPAVVETAQARAPGAPEIWPQAPGNLSVDWEQGDRAAMEAAFEKADHAVTVELVNNRVVVNSMEPRGIVASFDPEEERYTIFAGTQGAHRLRNWLAEHIFKVPQDKVRVVTTDVGGAFGMKIFIFPEQVAVAWAARKIGRPVRWMAERSESFVSDTQGRDQVTRARLALDKEGRMLGLHAASDAAMGAYLSNFAPFIPTACCTKMYSGLYAIPAIYGEVACVFTNTVPVDAYRGAGRPEAAYLVERLVDAAARKLKLAPEEIRRRNFIHPDQFPYKTPMGEVYDSGNYEAMMEKGMAAADWLGFAARRTESEAARKLRGIGMTCYVEACSGVGQESATLELDGEGKISILVGTQNNGQGHITAYSQILSDKLDVTPDDLDIRQGDSDFPLPAAGGTGGSRSLLMGGQSINNAADLVIKSARRLAGEILEAAEADIEFDAGRFRIVGTDREVSLKDVAREAVDRGAPLKETAQFEASAMTYPNGCHIAEVEVDPDTGEVAVVNYNIVDDFGTVVNPMMVAGQVHGGVAQGIGQALLEYTRYDSDSGQLLSGSFMDYCMPRADDMPAIGLTLDESTPCKTNEMGVKGAGEAGAIGACPAVINALVDALYPLGVQNIDMPATPERVWRAIQEARIS